VQYGPEKCTSTCSSLDFHKPCLIADTCSELSYCARRMASLLWNTYICEQFFSVTNVVKSKPRYRLDDERGLERFYTFVACHVSPGIKNLKANSDKILTDVHPSFKLKVEVLPFRTVIIIILSLKSLMADEIGGAYSMYKRDAKCMWYFGWNTWRE
jgi:hypothetical protein